ncbi:nuclear transport factor 2 family protein [Pseudomonas triticifolii]|uniref:Nuclear transport factor 2 family protein n=1 Tax=Pseudomonas triticifolii TaxID=2762592 RepID=A0ABR7BJG2_9PSED|nr:nuclear transport factor 2 family protein [Pseudomonas triticifolii]MBC3957316.1 nuclear transport factor 2 family protein [Pseudomonas triticifolii]
MRKLHPNVETLRAVYKDLARIAEFADNDIVLHKADRGARGGLSMIIGRRSVHNHELDLIEHTRQTLSMEVHEIVADDYFGAVIGCMRATCDRQKIAMPFCGLWRFRDGKIVEHWENFYDIRAFASFMTGDESLTSRWLSD